MGFAREAWIFVIPCAAAAAVLAALDRPAIAAGAGIAAVLLLMFFRIPPRPRLRDPEIVLAAASGKILHVSQVTDLDVSPQPMMRIATFLSVFDVHVQRAPVGGRVIASRHRSGRKVAAFRTDADTLNESHTTVFETADGERIGVRQIAGLVARRVVSYQSEGDRVEQGDLVGLIKFGSRVDLFVPIDYDVRVERGERVHVGKTVAARKGRST